jgi:hypothetical protein
VDFFFPYNFQIPVKKLFPEKDFYLHVNSVKIFLVLLLFALGTFLSTPSSAQTTGVKRATFSSSIGSSKYPQSIGQSSVVIGTSRVQSYDLLQGFLAPDFPIVSRSRETLELIRLQAYPNPFTSQLKLKLDRSYPYPLQLQLFSIAGLSVWSGEFPANTKELNLDQLDHLSVGVYLLRLYTTQQVFTQTLIKH